MTVRPQYSELIVAGKMQSCPDGGRPTPRPPWCGLEGRGDRGHERAESCRISKVPTVTEIG